MIIRKITLLYSSSQRSSSRANIHFSTFSIIAFLLEASSFALDICSSMLMRRSAWSISPIVHSCQIISFYSSKQQHHILENKYISRITPVFMRFVMLSISDCEGISMCDLLHISSSSFCFLWNNSFILLAFNWSSLLTSASALKPFELLLCLVVSDTFWVS